MSKVTPFLMFSAGLEDAVKFYTATFPDSSVTTMGRAGPNGPLMSAEFVVGGQKFLGFNAGGDHFKFSDAYSMMVDCVDQAEVDRYWKAILDAGGKESQCGWINDPWGLAWQIVPRRFMEMIADKNPKKVDAVVQAMLKMRKLIVADLEQAYRDA